MDKEKKKFPIGPEHYTLLEEIGEGVSALVYRALCILNNEIVAIKILDFERCNSDLKNISRESHTMFLVDHANVLKSHCSFVNDHNLWVVMPYMAGGSCLHILKAAHPDGFEEVVIATILREVLKGLEYLHSHGHIHRDVKAGNILIGSRGAVKLGDLGVSTCLFDSGDRQRTRNTFVGTPCWMAPEVMEQHNGYDFKADIWSFGITALELAHGHAPFSKYPPMKVLLMTIQYAPPTLNYERDKKFSKSFKQMIASCLVKDPAKRPTVKKLIKHAFFKQARSNEYITRTLLDGLPSLGDRIKALKRKEEDMLAEKKMAYGEKEELSQSEYKRGISTWNFNLEDMKAQAALIQDDDNLFDNDNGAVVGSSTNNHPQSLDNIYEDSESSNNQTSKTNCQNSDDDLGIASLENAKVASQCNSPRPTENIERNMGESSNNLGEVSSNEGMRKMVEKCSLPLHSRRASSSACTYTLDIPTKTTMRVESFKSPKHHERVLTNESSTCSQGDESTPRTFIPSPGMYLYFMLPINFIKLSINV
ncbi:serine/threonine-protein kinase OSR1-like [Chenopodium quinoa]|uniref:serine/threonine-protein kinase OSR1-like n=1 Tax=Chenopodium quinoa TaxID=63459 RepID=UPI000B78C975|nr:serine/threonine-protein kinase OSR1-like [Chenopodium quinoa]